MWLKRSLRSSSAILSSVALLQAQAAVAQTPGVHQQPLSSTLTATYATVLGLEPQLTASQRLALIKQKVKYVFVLFQENRSFEQFFGTFPGADGLYYPKNAKAGIQQADRQRRWIGRHHLAVPDPADRHGGQRRHRTALSGRYRFGRS